MPDILWMLVITVAMKSSMGGKGKKGTGFPSMWVISVFLRKGVSISKKDGCPCVSLSKKPNKYT